MFFFKQKTAYEMRISDWSSDVCSSDLVLVRHGCNRHHHVGNVDALAVGKRTADLNHRIDPFGRDGLDAKHHLAIIEKQPHFRFKRSIDFRVRQVHAIGVPRCLVAIESELCRSEEHTSELQSLMRISYAVFCLK